MQALLRAATKKCEERGMLEEFYLLFLDYCCCPATLLRDPEAP